MHAGSSSPTRDRTQAPCIGSMESYPLDHQGSPPHPCFRHRSCMMLCWTPQAKFHLKICLVWSAQNFEYQEISNENLEFLLLLQNWKVQQEWSAVLLVCNGPKPSRPITAVRHRPFHALFFCRSFKPLIIAFGLVFFCCQCQPQTRARGTSIMALHFGG